MRIPGEEGCPLQEGGQAHLSGVGFDPTGQKVVITMAETYLHRGSSLSGFDTGLLPKCSFEAREGILLKFETECSGSVSKLSDY